MRARSIRLTSLAVILSITASLVACGGGSSADSTSPLATTDALIVTAVPSATSSPVGTTGSDLSSRVQLDPDDGARHLAPGAPGSGYSESPATSGPHWFGPTTPVGVPAPARWGVYQFPLPDEILVHNLEHGGIAIHYNCPVGCNEVVDQLQALIPTNRSQFIMSPYPGMETRIAITAWRRHLRLDEFDESLIKEFIIEFQDRAPESVPGNTF